MDALVAHSQTGQSARLHDPNFYLNWEVAMATRMQTMDSKNHPCSERSVALVGTSGWVSGTLEDALRSTDWMAQYQRRYMQTAIGVGTAMACGLRELQCARTASQFIAVQSVFANQLLETSASEIFSLAQQLLDWQLLLNGQRVKLAKMPKV
jgi:hypothetical protein